jgi:hypothetical protein
MEQAREEQAPAHLRCPFTVVELTLAAPLVSVQSIPQSFFSLKQLMEFLGVLGSPIIAF